MASDAIAIGCSGGVFCICVYQSLSVAYFGLYLTFLGAGLIVLLSNYKLYRLLRRKLIDET